MKRSQLVRRRVAAFGVALAAGGVAASPSAVRAAPAPVVEYGFNNAAGTSTPSTGSNTTAALIEFADDGTTAANRNTAAGVKGGADLAYAPATSNASKAVAKYVGDLGASVNGATSVTALFWLRGNVVSAGSDRIFVLNGNDGSGTTGTLEVEANGGGSFNLKIGTQAQLGTNATSYTANVWSFLALTFDGSVATNNVKLYTGSQAGFNAAQAPQTFTSAATGLVDPTTGAIHQLLVGNRSDGLRGSGFAIDNFRLFNSALTPADIQSFYAADVPEPASFGVLGAAAGLGLLARRRRAV